MCASAHLSLRSRPMFYRLFRFVSALSLFFFLFYLNQISFSGMDVSVVAKA